MTEPDREEDVSIQGSDSEDGSIVESDSEDVPIQESDVTEDVPVEDVKMVEEEKEISPMMDVFLSALEKKFSTEVKKIWCLAVRETRQRFCSIQIREATSPSICSLEKENGKCPYHGECKTDFLRRCSFYYNNGNKCGLAIHSRDLTVKWCDTHLNMPKARVRLQRAGEFIVIYDTPYAVSDDLLSIIGRVEATYNLKFVLRHERDSLMEEVAQQFGLMIRIE